jgi:hydrogenase maturation protein HypF
VALGGDLKCAPALVAGGEVLLAEHIGDLACAAAADRLQTSVSELCRLARVEPRAVACDLHPDYVGRAIARRLGLPVVAVQHHHAHALACLAESAASGPALAWVLDGAGWAPDGTLWGGELLRVDAHGFERLGHLERVALPGADAAVREPWRIAAAWLERSFPAQVPVPRWGWHERQDPRALARVRELLQRGLHCPLTSSCGRLFDAVASLLGLGDRATHEGELAIALESLAARAGPARADGAHASECSLSWTPSGAEVPLGDLLRELVRGLARGERSDALAWLFHDRLAERLACAAIAAARRTGLRSVALSGGCTQNRLLTAALRARLEQAGLDVQVHRAVPPNDGGLALGQAIAAAARLLRG